MGFIYYYFKVQINQIFLEILRNFRKFLVNYKIEKKKYRYELVFFRLYQYYFYINVEIWLQVLNNYIIFWVIEYLIVGNWDIISN